MRVLCTCFRVVRICLCCATAQSCHKYVYGGFVFLFTCSMAVWQFRINITPLGQWVTVKGVTLHGHSTPHWHQNIIFDAIGIFYRIVRFDNDNPPRALRAILSPHHRSVVVITSVVVVHTLHAICNIAIHTSMIVRSCLRRISHSNIFCARVYTYRERVMCGICATDPLSDVMIAECAGLHTARE